MTVQPDLSSRPYELKVERTMSASPNVLFKPGRSTSLYLMSAWPMAPKTY